MLDRTNYRFLHQRFPKNLCRLTEIYCTTQRDCGVHATAEEAARARDAEALKEGVKRLNFPLETFMDTPVRVMYALSCAPSFPGFLRTCAKTIETLKTSNLSMEQHQPSLFKTRTFAHL